MNRCKKYYKNVGEAIDMDRTLLISRLDLQDDSNKKHKVFFTVEGISTPEISNRLIDLLHNCKFVDSKDIFFKYNGIELNIAIKQIPEIIKMLCKENFSIYEVYQPYNPE